MDGLKKQWLDAEGKDSRRFWSKVERSGGVNACWPWTASKTEKGYGQFKTRRQGVQVCHRAHRYAYQLKTGKTPLPSVVRHTCDNPVCCNPRHLLGGTQKDNIHDAMRRGRLVNPIGEQNGRAVLSRQQVMTIRRLYRWGNSKVLAKRFGVHRSTINLIAKGLSRRSG